MTKLVLKCGDIEIEYDGPEDFLKQELGEIIKAATQLRDIAGKKQGQTTQTQAQTQTGTPGVPQSVSTLAQKLAVNNGRELIMAAALSLVQGGTDSFTKKQLRDRARDATTFYKASYANNFDNYMGRLVKRGRLNHTGGENYALPPSEKTALEGRIGSAA